MGNAAGSGVGRSETEPVAPMWVGIGLSVALAVVTVWAWDRVELWTQIVLIALTGVAVVSLLATVVFRRGMRRSRTNGEKPGPEARAGRLFLYAAIGLGVISASFVGAILILNIVHIPLPEQFVLPMLLIGGTVAMLLTIAIVAVVFSGFKLSDPASALALPEGSVRAVIALLLILIFAIMAVFLYATLLKGNERTSKRITQAQIDVLPKDEIISIQAAGVNAVGEPLFNVELSVPANSAAQDFAKQLLTTVSTLVVAISAFYFGARTAAGAGVAGEPPALRIKKPKSPKVAKPGEKVSISLEVSPKGASVQGKVLHPKEYPQPQQVKPDDFTEWEWAAPTPLEKTVLQFSLTDYPDVVQTLEVEPRGAEPAEAVPQMPVPAVPGPAVPGPAVPGPAVPGPAVPGPDVAEQEEDEEEGEYLPPDDSPEATIEAGLTDTGVEPDEEVEFENDEGGVGP